jgi:hypothetical protein
METLKSFLKEFAILAPDASQAAVPQGDDTQIDVTSQDNDGQDDTVVNVDPDENKECVCKCDCPCCQKKRAEAGSVDDNIEVVDPQDGDAVDFNIDDDSKAATGDEDDDNDPLKDYDIF